MALGGLDNHHCAASQGSLIQTWSSLVLWSECPFVTHSLRFQKMSSSLVLGAETALQFKPNQSKWRCMGDFLQAGHLMLTKTLL